MPPADATQPDREESLTFTTRLNVRLLAIEKDVRTKAPLRRLDPVEYRNTIRDLLQIDVSLFDPSRDFPAEVGPAGRERISLESLTAEYLSAADRVIERAIRSGERPKEEAFVFTGRFSESRSVCAELLQRDDCETLLVGPKERNSALVPIGYEGIKHPGKYRIAINASAYNPEIYFDEIKGIEAGEPLRLEVDFSSKEGSRPPREIAYAAKNRLVSNKVFELNRDGEPHTYTWETWLEPTMKPRLNFANGPAERPSEVWVMKNFPDQWEFPNPQDADQTNWQHAMLRVLLDDYRGPMIHVHEIRIEGPCHDQWPPKSHNILLSKNPAIDSAAKAEELVLRFSSRAFRRPIHRETIRPILQLVRSRIEDGVSVDDAVKAGFKAVLCSPSFLFRLEAENELDNFQIASRLSYFLWSSMPDDRLLQLATEGKLTDPEVRRQEAKRMLDDPKAASFMTRFPDQWLNLDRPDIAPPDLHTFPLYFQYNLDHWSRRETHMFFEHVVRNDMPISQFVQSDFTFANYELSKLYGLPRVSGRSMRKVSLPDDRRGGLLGHSSVMLATTTGPETSPILRGVWVLNNLLGDRPAQPPNVPALEPDVTGAKTLKERIKRHSHDSACNTCHRKIDPLGFALESYDRIGRWRDTYPDGERIDTAGATVDGASFDDVVGLKMALSQRQDELARCLAEKLLEYARGRNLGVAETKELKMIVQRAKASDYRTGQLLLLVVQSELFTKR